MTLLAAVRRHPGLVTALLAAAGLTWWWTVRRMAGMDAGPGSDLGTLGWFTGSWVLMMAAMMLPSFAPTLAAYLASTERRGPSRWPLFVCGYLLAWAAAGLVAYAAFAAGRSLLRGELSWQGGGRWLSCGVILTAAAYELIPLKHAYLARCRGNVENRDRASGQGWLAALAQGIRSGGWCIACSWALMAALFALGAMSLTWMALIAALVALQKVGPWPLGARLASASVLTVLAVGIVAAPREVPGLVVPGSGGTPAMKAMS